MTIDETIKKMEMIAEDNQRVVDTHIVYDDVTIDMLYCDDTEVIEEHLANYQRCADQHRQLVEWLKELKQLRERTRWIPVSERLPDVQKDGDKNFSEQVLITLNIGFWKKKKVIGRAYYCFIDKKWYGYSIGKGEVIGVTAWMPLPEPCKAESEVQDADSD